MRHNRWHNSIQLGIWLYLALPSLAVAQNDFFDKMLSISDQELEKTSDMPEKKEAAPPAAPEQKPVDKDAPMVTPLAPLPAIPPSIPAPVANPPAPDKVEILMELPPEPDEALQKTGEAPEPPTQPITIPETKPTLSEKAAELPPAAPPVASNPGSLPSTLPAPPATAPTKPVTPSENWTGSMMFTSDEYQRLRQAISIYERKTGQKTALSGATPQGIPSAANRTPSFYLGSIAYVSSSQWAIWMNGKKYTKDTAPDEVNITNVASDRVRLVWKVDSLDIIIPDWRSKLTATGNGEYTSANNLVQVNSAGTEISFTLRPNQSFVSSGMRVAEGMVNDSLVSQ